MPAIGELYFHSFLSNQVLLLLAAITTLLISTMLIIFLLSYLANRGLVQSCLLLYLYQDFFRLYLLFIWFNFFTMIFFMTRGNATAMANDTDKLLAHMWYGISLLLSVDLVCIALIKFCMETEKVLDPMSSIIGADDRSAMTMIRLITTGSILCLTAFAGLMEIHPTIYYKIIGDTRQFYDRPTGTTVLGIIQLTIFLLFLVPTVAMENYCWMEKIDVAERYHSILTPYTFI